MMHKKWLTSWGSLLDRRCLAILLCLIAGLSARPACADRVDMQPLCDTLLVDLLTTAELIVEEDRCNALVRVYRLRENPPACADSPKPCPNERLFIALAAYYDAKPQQVFVLPYAFGWQNPHFVEGLGDPAPCSILIPHRFIQMDVEKVERDGQSKKGRLFLNMHEARISWDGGE